MVHTLLTQKHYVNGTVISPAQRRTSSLRRSQSARDSEKRREKIKVDDALIDLLIWVRKNFIAGGKKNGRI